MVSKIIRLRSLYRAWFENFDFAATAGVDGRPANLRHFDRQLEEITGRDVIVLPEMFTTGFAMEAAKQSMPQEVVAWMHAKAQQTNALIAGSAALQTNAAG
jgi:predicted amidohydrolase